MALNLNDVKNKKSILPRQSPLLVGESKEREYSFKNQTILKPEAKEKVLKPWEVFDESGNQTRTIVAQEAVRRARDTVRKNNLYAKRLRNKFKKTEDEYVEREKKIVLEECSVDESYNFKNSFSYFFRRLFN